MSKKQEIIDSINQWIQDEVIPNKLKIMVEAERTDAIDFESFRLSDVYIATRSVEDSYRDAEITVLVHQFDVNADEIVEVELDGFEFEEVYETDAYYMYIEEDAGLLFDKYENMGGEFGVESVLNNCNYVKWFYKKISRNLLVEYREEMALEKMISLEKAQQCFSSVVKVSYVSLTETELHFSSGVSLVLNNLVIDKAVKDYELIAGAL